jgi:hypothetical protein
VSSQITPDIFGVLCDDTVRKISVVFCDDTARKVSGVICDDTARKVSGLSVTTLLER